MINILAKVWEFDIANLIQLLWILYITGPSPSLFIFLVPINYISFIKIYNQIKNLLNLNGQ